MKMSFRKNYWSCSNFANWIRKTFGGFEKPHALELGQWDLWKKENEKRAPFVYWLTEEFLDKLQDIVMWPIDKIDNARVYIKNRFFDRLHYLPTRLTPGEYYDLDTRLLHGVFEALVDFVEIEKAHLEWVFGQKHTRPKRYFHYLFRWKSARSAEAGLKYLEWETTLTDDDGQPTQQALVAKEIIDLYNWWKTVRPSRLDPHDVSGWTTYCAETKQLFSSDLSTKEKEKRKEILNMCDAVEQQYKQEDEEMLIRLIKIREHLWI